MISVLHRDQRAAKSALPCLLRLGCSFGTVLEQLQFCGRFMTHSIPTHQGLKPWVCGKCQISAAHALQIEHLCPGYCVQNTSCTSVLNACWTFRLHSPLSPLISTEQVLSKFASDTL